MKISNFNRVQMWLSNLRQEEALRRLLTSIEKTGVYPAASVKIQGIPEFSISGYHLPNFMDFLQDMAEQEIAYAKKELKNMGVDLEK